MFPPIQDICGVFQARLLNDIALKAVRRLALSSLESYRIIKLHSACIVYHMYYALLYGK